MIIPFKLPSPSGNGDLPAWDGTSFVAGHEKVKVLEYSENFSGWSDDLTALHEDAAGDSHPIDLASRSDAIRQVENVLRYPNPVIMEIGCSSGFLLKDLVEYFPEATIIGADVVKEPLFRLSKTLPEVPLIRFDLLKCPLPNGVVDVLIMLNVLEHIEDDITALQKAFNLLKPGGALIIEVPAGPHLYDSYDAELFHFRRYSSSELEKKLSRVGFSLRRKSHLGFLMYPAFAMIKFINKWLPVGKEKSKVSKQAASSSRSKLVDWAARFESRYLSGYQLPFGIRVLAVAVRPIDS